MAKLVFVDVWQNTTLKEFEGASIDNVQNALDWFRQQEMLRCKNIVEGNAFELTIEQIEEAKDYVSGKRTLEFNHWEDDGIFIRISNDSKIYKLID